MKSPALRPLVHAGLLGFAFLAPVLGKWCMAGAALVAFLVNALVLPGTALGKALAREGEPRWNGLLAYPLAVALLFALFPAEAAVGGWAAMALGDPAAALVGGRGSGGVRIPWNRRKSLAGTATFFSAAWIGIAFVTATVFPEVMGLPSSRLFADGEALAIYAAWTAIGAFVGAVVESMDLGADDNLPVALAVGAALSLPGLVFPS
jgi:dolichol kinase